MNDEPQVTPLGDDALLVSFAQSVSWATGLRVRAVADRIRDSQLAYVTDVVPAYTTLAVYYDGGAASFESVASAISNTFRDNPSHESVVSEPIEIRVVYDGPDLAEVADRSGLTADDVIAKHCSRAYRVYMLGFVPGFAYLGDLDEALILPRRSMPRVRVPPGSVAIAGAQTAVYPLETPGGWHLIGTTSTVMFDARCDPPALLRAGDTVRFVRAGE